MQITFAAAMDKDQQRKPKHPKCKGKYDAMNGDYDCGYRTAITCDDCKYGAGRKDPEAKCNAI